MNPLSVFTVLLVVACASAQFRPWYAGSGLQYPRPFNQGGDAGDGLGDRAGFGPAATVPTNNRDAFGHDTKLVSDAANLPRESQPFWSLNREHILRHIGLNPNSQQAAGAAATQPAATQPAVAQTTFGNTDLNQPPVTTVDSSANFA